MTIEQYVVNGRPALRLIRRLPHSIERVWRAVSEPAELERWLVAEVPWSRVSARPSRLAATRAR